MGSGTTPEASTYFPTTLANTPTLTVTHFDFMSVYRFTDILPLSCDTGDCVLIIDFKGNLKHMHRC